MKHKSLFSLSGTVKKYNGNGRKLGYPTANIECSAGTSEGVFVGYTYLENQKLPSMIFVGVPETVGDKLKRAETHILDIEDKDLYGQNITIEVIKKLRDNQKFDSVDKLVKQMAQDEVEARAFFAQQMKI